MLQETDILKWMTKGKTKKYPKMESPPINYRPVICLLMIMWKILTVQITEEIYDLLINCGLFPEEQKVCCKWIRGTGELLYIDQHLSGTAK